MSPLRLLREGRRYRRLCAATAISQTGDWLLFIALPLYVLRVSGSALDTSSVFLAELVPAVVIGMTCGPLIDRHGPGRLLAWITPAQALLMLPLLALRPGRLWLIYLVAGLEAAASSLSLPAQQAAVPALVAPESLGGANATLEMAANAARLIGGPLGGILLPLLGLRALVAVDLVSFLLAAALLVGLGYADTRRSAGRPRALAEGWQAVRGSPTLRAALAIAFLGALAQGLFLVLYVLFVLRALHAGDQVVGLLRGVQAIGGVLGGVVVGGWAARAGSRALTVGGLAAFGVLSAVTWNSPMLTTAAWWYVVLFVVVGVPATALSTGLITGTQTASPAHARGRVLSLVQVADAVGHGTGILAAGLLANHLALGLLLNLQAGCYLTCAVVAVIAFAHPPTAGLE